MLVSFLEENLRESLGIIFLYTTPLAYEGNGGVSFCPQPRGVTPDCFAFYLDMEGFYAEDLPTFLLLLVQCCIWTRIPINESLW